MQFLTVEQISRSCPPQLTDHEEGEEIAPGVVGAAWAWSLTPCAMNRRMYSPFTLIVRLLRFRQRCAEQVQAIELARNLP